MSSSSFYTGPSAGRLSLDSWDEVETAAAAGLLDESHWVELKEDVPAASKGANVELGKDLASLSVDGGLLVVGIKDDNGAAGDVVGVPEAGPLSNRMVDVAVNIRPPLHVEVHAVPSPTGAAELLLVRVPASATAPHMVDYRYWGRSDHGKTQLADTEVSRLFDVRRADRANFTTQLANAQSRDLTDVDARRLGHGYIVLRPLGFDASSGAGDPFPDLATVVREALDRAEPRWPPSMKLLGYNRAHPDGLMVVSRHLEPGEQDADYLQLLVRDDGQLEVVTGAITTSGYDRGEDVIQTIPAGYALELVHCSVLLGGHLSEKYFAHFGQWEAGVVFTGLKGLYSSSAGSSSGYHLKPFATDEYTRTTVTTTSELCDEPAEVVTRLLTGFVRGLGDEDTFLPYKNLSDIYINREAHR